MTTPICSTKVETPPQYFDEIYDCNAGKQGPFRFLFQCDPGVSVATATVSVIDENGYPVPYDALGETGDSLLIEFDRIELVTNDPTVLTPDTYGVYFFLTHGTPKVYRLQCRGTKSGSPTISFPDAEMYLVAKR